MKGPLLPGAALLNPAPIGLSLQQGLLPKLNSYGIK
jgi:hypothetical protein